MKLILKLLNKWFASSLIRAIFDSIIEEHEEWGVPWWKGVRYGALIHKSNRFMLFKFETGYELVNAEVFTLCCKANAWERFVLAVAYNSWMNEENKREVMSGKAVTR